MQKMEIKQNGDAKDGDQTMEMHCGNSAFYLKAVSHANVADILGKIVVKDDGFPAINSLGEVN